MLSRQSDIVGIHCVTTANALRFGANTTKREDTRLMLLLQGAAFMTMFRVEMDKLADTRLDRLEAVEPAGKGPAAIEDIFASVSKDRASAARKTLAYLRGGGSADELLTTARRLTFLKGTDSHDYKFSSAALEDYRLVSPEWRALYLASAMFNLEGSENPDNPLLARARAVWNLSASKPALRARDSCIHSPLATQSLESGGIDPKKGERCVTPIVPKHRVIAHVS